MDFSILGHYSYFCFVLNCLVALKIITETMRTYQNSKVTLHLV